MIPFVEGGAIETALSLLFFDDCNGARGEEEE